MVNPIFRGLVSLSTLKHTVNILLAAGGKKSIKCSDLSIGYKVIEWYSLIYKFAI